MWSWLPLYKHSLKQPCGLACLRDCKCLTSHWLAKHRQIAMVLAASSLSSKRTTDQAMSAGRELEMTIRMLLSGQILKLVSCLLRDGRSKRYSILVRSHSGHSELVRAGFYIPRYNALDSSQR